MVCDRCYQPEDVGAHGHGVCPLEPRRLGLSVRPDSIPGGIEIAHGLCNADGSPRRYDSRSEIRQAAAAKGLIPWSEVHTEDRLKDARVQQEWLQSGEARRAKADRDAQRREGVYRPPTPTVRPVTPNPERLKRIRQIVAERMRSL